MRDFFTREPGAPQPVRFFQANNLKDSVSIPLLQALTTGAFLGVFSGALTAVMQSPASAWIIGALAGSAGALLAWLGGQRFWRWTIERLLSDELNLGASVQVRTSEQLPSPESVRIELVQDEGRRGDYIDLPCRDRLPQLASGVLAGRQFAQSVWTGNGAPFSRSEFEALRAALITAGLLRWKREGAPAQGVDVTPAGRAVFKRLASSPPLSEDE